MHGCPFWHSALTMQSCADAWETVCGLGWQLSPLGTGSQMLSTIPTSVFKTPQQL
jgi:hypothetical protein